MIRYPGVYSLPASALACVNFSGRIAYRLTPLKFITQRAYKVQDLEVLGPDWLSSERFDIEAKIPDGDSNADLPGMLQTLLTERFNLSFHNETRDLTGFVLTVGPSGAKLDAAKSPNEYSMAISKQLGMKLEAKKVPVKMIVIDHIDKVPEYNQALSLVGE